MILIRNFTAEDAAKVKNVFGGDTEKLISEWESKQYNGKYFEMLAIVDDGTIVGTVSLYEHSESVVSLGIEIFEEYRRAGRASAACELALGRAKELGYRIAMDQVRADNAASIALHRRLEFENDGYVYINHKNREVLIYIRPIG